ncbi:hypothetical protein HDU86_001608 [Geranomyces michiganensis]|nr:hypothetical protein HDU86_001608 [Geranomyces michiganensis]
MCAYGAYLAYYVFILEMRVQQVDLLVIYDYAARTRVPLTREQKWMYMVHRELLLTALGMFCICAGVVVLAFTLYQLSLIVARGITTNESFKWDDVAYDIKEGVVHLPRWVLDANRRGVAPRRRQRPSSSSLSPVESASSSTRVNGKSGRAGGGGGKARKRKQQQQQSKREKPAEEEHKDDDDNDDDDEIPVPDADELVTIKSIKELRNIYDLGWWRNLMDVVFPIPL